MPLNLIKFQSKLIKIFFLFAFLYIIIKKKTNFFDIFVYLFKKILDHLLVMIKIRNENYTHKEADDY